MDYVFKIKHPWIDIGCNPGNLEIKWSDCERGAKRLYDYLEALFPGNVVMYEDISQRSYQYIYGNKELF